MKNFYLNKNYRICRDPADVDCIYAICNDVNSLIEEFHEYDIDESWRYIAMDWFDYICGLFIDM